MTDLDQIVLASKFGRRRVATVLHHQETRRNFYWHQCELAAVGALQVVFFAASTGPFEQAFFASLAMLCITCGEREARRMRACGRYHQCNRSLEVIGI
jgi:hypothetical protein